VSLVHQSPVAEPVTGREQNIDPTEAFGQRDRIIDANLLARLQGLFGDRAAGS
jgi:hypothetical protein